MLVRLIGASIISVILLIIFFAFEAMLIIFLDYISDLRILYSHFKKQSEIKNFLKFLDAIRKKRDAIVDLNND